MKYHVVRGHVGDKDYVKGDIREADPADVAHLIGLCLEPVAEGGASGAKADKAKREAKADAAPIENKGA